MHSHFKEHLAAIYRILRYLKANPGKGLFFKKNAERNVSIFTDADWVGEGCPSYINAKQAIPLSIVGLNPPLHTQHNEGVGGCNEGNPNATIRRMGRTAMKAEFPTEGVVVSSAKAELRAMAPGICKELWKLSFR
ncbi:putative copia-type protein [Trifolium pratense]|uniref:Putative copia-type protein n=1 Tax=Trifolium pratense TaxID=57577 RepID=A0A2K3MM22_TRIPR|nr:putative copia-type protein [Trifolium pratense]